MAPGPHCVCLRIPKSRGDLVFFGKRSSDMPIQRPPPTTAQWTHTNRNKIGVAASAAHPNINWRWQNKSHTKDEGSYVHARVANAQRKSGDGKDDEAVGEGRNGQWGHLQSQESYYHLLPPKPVKINDTQCRPYMCVRETAHPINYVIIGTDMPIRILHTFKQPFCGAQPNV